MADKYLRIGFRFPCFLCSATAVLIDWFRCTLCGVGWRWGWRLMGFPRSRARGGGANSDR